MYDPICKKVNFFKPDINKFAKSVIYFIYKIFFVWIALGYEQALYHWMKSYNARTSYHYWSYSGELCMNFLCAKWAMISTDQIMYFKRNAVFSRWSDQSRPIVTFSCRMVHVEGQNLVEKRSQFDCSIWLAINTISNKELSNSLCDSENRGLIGVTVDGAR